MGRLTDLIARGSNVTENDIKYSKANRRKKIVERLLASGSILVDEIAAELGVSRMTIHRDLDALAHEGLIRKVRGGASVDRSVLFESNHNYRRSRAVNLKRRLARSAINMIEPGSAVFLDASTTCAQVAELIPEVAPLTVITNAHGIISRLRSEEDIDLICVGGTYSDTFDAFLGVVTEKAVRSLRADLLFLSISAVRGITGYHQDEQVIRTNRAMMESADRRVLLVDHTKFGKSALNWFAKLTEFDEVIVDSDLDKDAHLELLDAEVKLKLAYDE